MFALDPTEPLNSNFEAVGFESVYFLHNLGTFLVAYLLYPVLMLLQKILKCCGSLSEKVAIRGEQLRQTLYYNFMIT